MKTQTSINIANRLRNKEAQVLVSFFVGKIIIFVNNMESRSFPSSPDIAGRYAKHRVLDFCMLRGTGNAPHLALQMQ